MAKIPITVRLPENYYQELQTYADEKNITLTDAVLHYLEIAFYYINELFDTTAQMKELVDETKAAAEKNEKQIQDALRELGIARKNIGKATQASLASLSMLSWFYHDFMMYWWNQLSSEDNETVIGQRLTNWVNSPISELFDFFKSSGGALQADPKMLYFASFITALQKTPYKDKSIEELLGMHENHWERLSGQSNDVEALRKAATNQKRKNRK